MLLVVSSLGAAELSDQELRWGQPESEEGRPSWEEGGSQVSLQVGAACRWHQGFRLLPGRRRGEPSSGDRRHCGLSGISVDVVPPGPLAQGGPRPSRREVKWGTSRWAPSAVMGACWLSTC